MTTRIPAQPSNSEWLTRKQFIDSMLRTSGWKVVPFKQEKSLASQECCAIEEYPTLAGPADYALCLDGQIIAIVEAKKLTLGPQNVLSQAGRYSKGLKQHARKNPTVANSITAVACRWGRTIDSKFKNGQEHREGSVLPSLQEFHELLVEAAHPTARAVKNGQVGLKVI
jgi:type I site-specific restriction endonuclease